MKRDRGKRSWPSATPFYVLIGASSLLAILLLLRREVPLGVPGEWVWNRAPTPLLVNFLLPTFAVVIYIGFVWAGWRTLQRRGERWIGIALPCLVAAGAMLQAAWLDLPVEPLGLERWSFALQGEATSGYFQQAQRLLDVDEPLEHFLHDYEGWLAGQDSFHIGTHPPGLIVINYAVLKWFRERPAGAGWIARAMPSRYAAGLKWFRPRGRFGVAESAALFILALTTFFAALASIPLLYLLARAESEPASAWLAASLWPMVPAVLLFLPLSDCLYPPIALAVVAPLRFAVHRGLPGAALLGLAAGAAFWLGMQLSLAFLAVAFLGFAALLAAWWGESVCDRRSCRRIAATLAGALLGFALPTLGMQLSLGVDLPAIWATNLRKHAGFYDRMPRTYVVWSLVDLLEFAVSVGPPVIVAAIAALWMRTSKRLAASPTAAAFLLTLSLLDFAGRNLSEVARLWIFLTPFACAAAARTFQRFVARDAGLTFVLGCQAAVCLALTATVEPLLPINAAALDPAVVMQARRTLLERPVRITTNGE